MKRVRPEIKRVKIKPREEKDPRKAKIFARIMAAESVEEFIPALNKAGWLLTGLWQTNYDRGDGVYCAALRPVYDFSQAHSYDQPDALTALRKAWKSRTPDRYCEDEFWEKLRKERTSTGKIKRKRVRIKPRSGFNV